MYYEAYSAIRDEKGVTDYQVSKATGVATATISEWKKGTYTPKLEKLMKIADYFGVTIDALVR